MGLIYDAKVKLEQIIRERRLDAADVRGKLSLRAGMLLALVRPDSPDDPVKLDRLRAAARELLQIEL